MAAKLDLIIFDWDGTLIDSAAYIVECFQVAGEQLGWPARTAAQIRDIIGLGWVEACRVLYPGYGDAELERLRLAYRDYFFSKPQPSKLFDGARDVLATLSQRYPLAIATGKSSAGLKVALAETELRHYFAACRSADETASKPDPLMLRELMQELGVAPERTLMVGDTEYDMAMACNAGAGAVAVAYGVHEAERLLAYNPLACIEAITQLPAVIERFEAMENP
ncbi:MAG: HAD-IA family hydrolase [Gammaproteobacteria bacterium]